MKRELIILPVLLLGVSAASHAFTLDIASNEVTEFGQGPRSIVVPGYGEVVFTSALDCVLVMDSAYASTARIEVPPPSGEPAAERSIDDTAVVTDPGFVEITNRSNPDLPFSLQTKGYPIDDAIQTPPGGWNAVPEAASATLGLIGTLILLLRRHVKTMHTAPGKP